MRARSKTSPSVAGLVLSALVVSACAKRPPTAVVVAVRAELRSPEVDALALTSSVGAETRFSRAYELSKTPLPGTLTFTEATEGGGAHIYEARLTRGGATVISRRARFGFVHEKTKLFRLALEVSCAGVTCASPDTTCIRGACAPIDVDPATLPDATAEDTTGHAACYDERTCFSQAPKVALVGCAFPLTGDAAKLGVAVEGANDDPSVLTPGVAYSVAGATVTLAAPVCAAVTKLGLAVVAAYACAPLGAAQETCPAPPSAAGGGGHGGTGGAAGASGTSASGGSGQGGKGGSGAQGGGGMSGASGQGGGAKAGASGTSGASGQGGGGGAKAGAGGQGGIAGQGGTGGVSGASGQGGLGPTSGCGDTSGTMDGAFWPMVGQCVTRMSAAPFVGPTGANPLWTTTMPGVVLAILVLPSGDLVVSWSTGLGIVSKVDGTVTTTLANGTFSYGVALAKGGLILAGNAGDLYGWDATSLSQAWGPTAIGAGKMVAVLAHSNNHAFAVETGGNIRDVDTTTGVPSWTQKAGNSVSSMPVLDSANDLLGFHQGHSLYRVASNGIAFPPVTPATLDDTRDPAFTSTGYLVYGAIDGVVALALDGTQKWKAFAGTFPGTVAVDALGRVLSVGPGFSGMVAIDATSGTKVWQTTGSVSGFRLGMASDKSGTVFGASDDGVVHAFNGSNGTELWSLPSKMGVQPTCFPALAPGAFYVGFGTTLVAVGP